MNEEQRQELLFRLSGVLMTNEKREAEAVEGYNEQLKIIALVRDAYSDNAEVKPLLEYLDKLEAATKEKIQDELNHGQSLYAEYTEMTGIQPAED